MPASNGVKATALNIGATIFLLIPIIVWGGNHMIANDKKSTNERNKIKDTMIERDEKLMEGLHKFEVRQEVLIKTVEQINEKVDKL